MVGNVLAEQPRATYVKITSINRLEQKVSNIYPVLNFHILWYLKNTIHLPLKQRFPENTRLTGF